MQLAILYVGNVLYLNVPELAKFTAN